MKLYLFIIFALLLSCKRQSASYKVRDYYISVNETLNEFRFYLFLDSQNIDSIYILKHNTNRINPQQTINLVDDCIFRNINVNERFLKTIINKEGISLTDTSKLLAYIHKLTNNTFIDNFDMKWDNNYKTLKEYILTGIEGEKSEEYHMYKNVFKEIEKNGKEHIYLVNKSNLFSRSIYSPIYKISISNNNEIEYKEITCDISRLRSIYE